MNKLNEFAERYKEISNSELLEILENPLQYQALALEAAKSEFTTRQLSEQEILRRQKLEELIKFGINPYPADEWKTDYASTYILDEFEAQPE